MKDCNKDMSELQKLSGLDAVKDIKNPDWDYVHTLPNKVCKKFFRQWEKENPHRNYDVTPGDYIEDKLSNAMSMIQNHAKKLKVGDETIQVQWSDDWNITGTWEKTESNIPEMNDFMEIAYNEGYYPDSINRLPTEIESMTDRDILIGKMGLTEKQADYVIMLKEAQGHLRRLNKIRNEW